MADNKEKAVAKAAKTKEVKPVAKKEKKPSIFKRIKKWFRDNITEIKKITWPTAKQTVKNTLVVIAMVVVVGGYIGIVDLLLGYGIDLVRSLIS